MYLCTKKTVLDTKREIQVVNDSDDWANLSTSFLKVVSNLIQEF